MRPWFAESLVCPECRAPLRFDDPRCACGFRAAATQPLDLRPSRPLQRALTMPVSETAHADLDAIDILRPNLTYRARRGMRDSSELFSAAAPQLRDGARFLDLGCGPRDQVSAAEHFGLRYAGVDYASPDADLLADAHALPFADASFDAVLAYAVLEHLHNPFLAAAEAARVLAPGGVFFGAVSQGEPFHESYFHHTALGTLALLRAAGFRATRLWPSYDTLHSLATMGRYPKLTRAVIELTHHLAKATPLLAPRAFFRLSQRQKQMEELYRAASICFVAERDPSPGLRPPSPR